MTVGAVSQFHLDRIIRVCQRADLAADIVGYGGLIFTKNADGTYACKDSWYRPTRRERARNIVLGFVDGFTFPVHAFRALWLAGRWA